MKLTQIPKTKIEQPKDDLHEIVESAPMEDEELNVYGLNPNDPDYATKIERLRRLRDTDIDLYRKLTGLD